MDLRRRILQKKLPEEVKERELKWALLGERVIKVFVK